MIITIGRECGSGGKTLGEQLSKQLNIPLYDKNLLEMAAMEGNLDLQTLLPHDEISSQSYLQGNTIFTKLFQKSALDDTLFSLESQIIKQLSSENDCILIGRCSNFILRDRPTINIFLYSSDQDFKIHRKMQSEHLTEKEAKKYIAQTDQTRAQYYHYHTGGTWGNKQEYDILPDTAKLGFSNIVSLIAQFYKQKKESELYA